MTLPFHFLGTKTKIEYMPEILLFEGSAAYQMNGTFIPFKILKRGKTF